MGTGSDGKGNGENMEHTTPEDFDETHMSSVPEDPTQASMGAQGKLNNNYSHKALYCILEYFYGIFK